MAVPLAAALVGGLGVTAVVQSRTSEPGGPAVTSSGGRQAPVTELSSEQILLAAAVTARSEDARAPSPRSFVYTRTAEQFADPRQNDTREA